MKAYHNELSGIASRDVETIIRKDTAYDGSWAKRGGVGAFFSMVRKWDRLEAAMQNGVPRPCCSPEERTPQYDIFEALRVDQRQEGILDDLRDMRQYLMLIEAYIIEEGARGTSR